MLEGGEDPRFIARRMIILASEDIGNADPRALLVAVAAAQAVEHVGLPEARLNLAQAAVYLARAPKSNASYRALGAARGRRARARPPPPAGLRSARPPTPAPRSSGGARATVYPHEDPAGFEVDCLPDELKGRVYYTPSGNGEESGARGSGRQSAARPARPRARRSRSPRRGSGSPRRARASRAGPTRRRARARGGPRGRRARRAPGVPTPGREHRVDGVEIEAHVQERDALRASERLAHHALDPVAVDVAHREDVDAELGDQRPLALVERAGADDRGPLDRRRRPRVGRERLAAARRAPRRAASRGRSRSARCPGRFRSPCASIQRTPPGAVRPSPSRRASPSRPSGRRRARAAGGPAARASATRAATLAQERMIAPR